LSAEPALFSAWYLRAARTAPGAHRSAAAFGDQRRIPRGHAGAHGHDHHPAARGGAYGRRLARQIMALKFLHCANIRLGATFASLGYHGREQRAHMLETFSDLTT